METSTNISTQAPEAVPELRTKLQQEFVARCKRNRAYSLRSFARYLQIDQSLLSKILKNKHTPSATLSRQLEAKLGLEAALRPSTFTTRPQDEVQLIGNWLHFALLELAKTKQFSPKPAIIARRLGVHAEEVADAVSRLMRLGFLQIDADGNWQLLSPNNNWSNTAETSEARRLLQKELLEKSLTALEEIPFAEREHGSLTVAIAKSDLPRLKARLGEMRLELGQMAQANNKLDEVYQLTLALFPLTKAPRSHS